jgi:phosphoheptose isomerase
VKGSRIDLQPTISEAIAEHLTVIQQLTAASSLILQVASELVTTLRRQGKVVLCGNGGSASDAQHIAAEMQGIRAHPGTPQGLLALVLTENTALFTAISNDVGYAAAFRRQVEAIVRKDDLVIGLSTSGRSLNVLEAIRAARQIGARTVALLGEQGELAAIADLAICIPSTSVPRIQEAHMFEFIPLSFWYDAPLTSQDRDRRHDPWLVYGSPTYSPARWRSWISPA